MGQQLQAAAIPEPIRAANAADAWRAPAAKSPIHYRDVKWGRTTCEETLKDLFVELPSGDDEINALAVFNFSPEEKATHDYPGCPAEVELLHLFGSDLIDIKPQLSDEAVRSIEDTLYGMHLEYRRGK